jgi:hypothetical protein
VSMNQLFLIWFTILLYVLLPVLIIVAFLISPFLAIFVCPCLICYWIFNRDDNIFHYFMELYFSFLEYLFQESEPKLSTITVHPFKLRSPLSTSKRYKSPENLAKILQKPSPEVSSLYVLYQGIQCPS